VELVSLLEYEATQDNKQLLMSLGWTQQLICQLRGHHFPEDVDLQLGNECTVKEAWCILCYCLQTIQIYILIHLETTKLTEKYSGHMNGQRRVQQKAIMGSRHNKPTTEWHLTAHRLWGYTTNRNGNFGFPGACFVSND
jgi:hypothetical protein